MVKNKKVLIIFLILIALILGIVLSSVLLKVRRFDVQIQSSPNFALGTDFEDATDPYLGKSVIFLNTGDIKRDMEKEYPYARVVSVGKEVSSTVVVKLAERYEYFWLTNGNDSVVTDRDLKVLKTVSGEPESVDGLADKPVKVLLPEGAILSSEPGETVTFKRSVHGDFLKAFVAAADKFGRDAFDIRQHFSEFDLRDVALGAVGEIEDNAQLRGRFGCLFEFYRPTQNPEAFLERTFAMFYEEFDTADRERANYYLTYEDGKAVAHERNNGDH